jgi:hypothetical protein
MPSPAPHHPELPFASEIVTVALTRQQEEQLWPLIRRQTIDHLGLLFVSAAPFLDLEQSETRLRLQAVYLNRKISQQILKLIRKTVAKNNGLTAAVPEIERVSSSS